jgi:outer membrane protein OmpA-like peptidoglycan-associated protein
MPQLTRRFAGLARICLFLAGCTQQRAPATVSLPAPRAVVQIDWSPIVFFDFDSAQLTDRARHFIAWAVKTAHFNIHVNGYVMQVTGSTDSFGSPSYNRRLSLRRAQSVAAELERDGVAHSDIVIRGLGDQYPLVPTPRGRREPQNRRVEFPRVSQEVVHR